MANIKDLKPFKIYAPGYFIQEQMDVREWNQTDLAEVLGLSVKTVNQLIQGKQAITLETARLLGEAFGQSPQYWMNLETNYRIQKDEISPSCREVKIKSPIYEYMPVQEMTRKGWLQKVKNAEDLEKQVKLFWNVPTLDFLFMNQPRFQIACRKSDAYSQFSKYALFCWLQMARNCAKNIHVPAYDKERLTLLYDQIHTYSRKEDGIRLFIEKLNECGVKFMVLSHLQKTYLDGATFIDDENPVVVYTARYKRTDNFWFTLAHEIAHVLLHLSEENNYFLDNLSETSLTQQEQEADALAQTKLKHDEILSFFSEKMKYMTANDISRCAQQLDISEGVIVGTLAHDKTISYSHLYQFNPNPIEYIPLVYMLEKEMSA